MPASSVPAVPTANTMAAAAWALSPCSSAAAGRPPRPGAVVVEAMHGVAAGPVGPQVLEAAEPLLEVAVSRLLT